MSEPAKKLKFEDAEPSAGPNGFAAALQKLDDVQAQLDKVNDEASDKVLEVEQQYNRLRKPIYQQRNEEIRDIPQFWMTALLNHPTLRGICSDDDISVLEHCTEVYVEDQDDIKSGFNISFTFSEDNPHFSTQVLTKEYHYMDDGTIKIKGTVPEWYEGEGPGPAYGVGVKRDQYRNYQFFTWFVESEELPAGQHDEVADVIKEDIWPNPVKYYNGDIDVEVPNDLEEEEEEEEDGEGELVFDEDEVYEEGDEGAEAAEYAEGEEYGEGDDYEEAEEAEEAEEGQ